MGEEKVFCVECRNDVDYTINEKVMEGTLKGEKYTYIGKEANCVECNSEIYVPYVHDYNLKALYDAYRIKNNIISVDKILEIPQKYAIGKRPLSLLLGWGEQTFTRYCEGYIPSKQYSEILEKIYDEPAYYADILEKNKDNLKSIMTYEKSRAAVDNLLGITQYEKNLFM